MSTWNGHSPVTRSVVLGILVRAALGDAEFSHDERLLCTVCDFWAAVSNGELSSWLRTRSEDELRAAQSAFLEIGASAVARELDAAALSRPVGTSSLLRQQWATELGRRLACTQDRVDLLIATRVSTRHAKATTCEPSVAHGFASRPAAGRIGYVN